MILTCKKSCFNRLFLSSARIFPSFKSQEAACFYSSSTKAGSLATPSSILRAAQGEQLDSKQHIRNESNGNETSDKSSAVQQSISQAFPTLTNPGEERRLPLLDTNTISSDGTMSANTGTRLTLDGVFKDVTWQMHVYAHRHNIHITVARPPAWRHPITGKIYGENPPSRSVALSLSAGRLGFKHSGRKLYDSAFQLGTYVMARMQESGMNSQIEKLEVYLRGYGAGREAVTRVLLGLEGKYLRNKIIKVADSTRLKIGGTRSANPRRLG
ncbi:37S ribosomal protein S18, mitochondrial [Golovinomyces cichoracearum]|uniref:37S ribosomal protein S18, mitochondrial n=1 Tax=Golovinomyces cichoracearum TaxID=62708 RepID=A0A420HXB4_9PEZI|nr:37S ribosomal protein S18, mitochondrial [Golovinomyces cichoracearum]